MKKHFNLVSILIIGFPLVLASCSQDKEEKCFIPSTTFIPIPGQTKEECRKLLLLDVIARNSRKPSQTSTLSTSEKALLHSNCLIMQRGTITSYLYAFSDNSDLSKLVQQSTAWDSDVKVSLRGLSDAFYESSNKRWIGVGRSSNLGSSNLGRVFYSDERGRWIQAKRGSVDSDWNNLTTISKDSDGRYLGYGVNDSHFRSSTTNLSQGQIIENSLGFTNRYEAYSSAFGAGKIVIVGRARQNDLVFPSHIQYTTDGGMSYYNSSSHLNTTNYLYEIIYANNIFVAVGLQGLITTSTDGITWTSQTHGTENLYGIAYGNNKYVAVGVDTKILTTSTPSNPSSWTPVNVSGLGLPSGSTITSIAYDSNNSRFIALVNTPANNSIGSLLLLTSSDGVTWSVTDPEERSILNARIRCK